MENFLECCEILDNFPHDLEFFSMFDRTLKCTFSAGCYRGDRERRCSMALMASSGVPVRTRGGGPCTLPRFSRPCINAEIERKRSEEEAKRKREKKRSEEKREELSPLVSLKTLRVGRLSFYHFLFAYTFFFYPRSFLSLSLVRLFLTHCFSFFFSLTPRSLFVVSFAISLDCTERAELYSKAEKTWPRV